MSLWSELSSLTQDQFVAEIESILSPSKSAVNAKKKKPKPAKKLPQDDRPVTRIAFVLRDEKQLSSSDAQQLMDRELLQRGYEPADIPEASDSLEEWLEKLLTRVPSSDVMDAAKKVA